MNMRIALLACGLVLLAATPAKGQSGWFHVDDGRPVRVQDAYPTELHEWEWQLGADAAGGGPTELGSVLELKTGLLRNLQVGSELHVVAREAAGAWRRSVEDVAVHGIYGLAHEGRRTPALALRLDGRLPIGERERTAWDLMALATRTWGGQRWHLNAARRFSQDDARWLAGLGFDRALGLSSRSVLADVFVEAPDDGSGTVVWIELGSRLQATRRAVLDVGAFVRAGEGEATAVGVRVGWTRSFGIGGLIPVPEGRTPRLR